MKAKNKITSTLSPEAYLTYCHLGLPDDFNGKKTFNCVATFNHSEYTLEQKKDLFNFLCYIVREHPQYDNTKKSLDQFESLGIGKITKEGYYQIKPRQNYKRVSTFNGVQNTYIFKVDVKNPDGVQYGLPKVDSQAPWMGVDNPIPMFGEGTKGRVSIEAIQYAAWTGREGKIVDGGVELRLHAVDITHEVQYQSKNNETKSTSSPVVEGFDEDMFGSNTPTTESSGESEWPPKDFSDDVKEHDSFDDDIPF